MSRKLISITLILLSINAFADLESDALQHINKFRAQHSLTTLVVDERICEIARQHSLDMANHILPFGHDGFSTRMLNLHKLFPNSGAGAENVAYNYKTAELVATGWINSSGHRKNILGPYNLTCIATARDTNGKIYYTQLFLKN